MNDTMGPEGLVPSLLVFRILPRFAPDSTSLPYPSDLIMAMEVARREMNDIESKLKIQQALRSNILPVSGYLVNPEDEVYFHDENTSNRGRPYTVLRKFSERLEK